MQLQYNATTKTPYEGRNQAVLLAAKEESKFNSDQWITFLQAKDNGLMIKRGSHGIGIVKFVEVEVERDGKLEVEHAPKYYKVFNLDQTEKL